ALLQEQARRCGTERMPLCHIPEVIVRPRFVRHKVELPTQGRQPLLLCLQKLWIIPPRGLIRVGTHHMQMDRPVLAFECWLHALPTSQRELSLGTYAIREIINTVVRQMENSICPAAQQVSTSPLRVLEPPHRP